MPTLKETEVSFSMYNVSCIFFNKCIFHITWLDTFWTVYICNMYILMKYLEGQYIINSKWSALMKRYIKYTFLLLDTLRC